MGYIEDLRKLIGHTCVILSGSLVIIRDENDRILLQLRTYPKGKWGLPGGLMEMGESTVETAKREVLEETNLTVDNLELLGVYSGKDYLCKAENGDEWYVVITAYTTNNYKGELRINDGESEKLEWFAVEDIPENIANTHRAILEDYADLFNSGKL